MMAGAISFAAPWAFVALLLLPALWWLLRLVPPAPRRQVFPAIRLLAGLVSRRTESARTPPWLLALRLILAMLLIAAASHPILNPAAPAAGDTLLIVVDNGWASARSWAENRGAIDRLLDGAERAGQPVALLQTAPGPDGAAIPDIKPGPAGEIRSRAGGLAPEPWETDRAQAKRVADRFAPAGSLRIMWFADGLGGEADEAFARSLSAKGALEVVLPASSAPARILTLSGGGEISLTVRRAQPGLAERIPLRALDSAGRVLARQSVELAAGKASATAPFPMPTELRNRIGRFDIEGDEAAASTVLVDDRFKHRVAGLVNRGGSSSPLLDDLYYADRALAPVAEVRRGTVDDLLSRDLSMIVLADAGTLSDQEQGRLARWVDDGGILLRFAGPKLARNPDDLLPVRLLSGGRTLGGALSWTRPMALAPAADGPLAGLDMPPDILVSAQVLAEPSVDLAAKSWARLMDGTPIVTGAPKGRGWLVLVHTTAGPGWSNLGLSGLFPQMMGRILDLGRGFATAGAEKPLAPLQVMDGSGHLSQSLGAAEALPAAGGLPRPGPAHPPGYYGTDQNKVAFNLGAALADPRPLSFPDGAKISHLGERPAERDLQPILLIAALVLLFADMAAALWLKGAFVRMAAIVLLMASTVLFLPGPGQAAPPPGKAEQAALATRLAYAVTGDAALDEVSRAGLKSLSQMIARRTTTVLDEPVGVDPESDDLAVYPLLYWPVSDRQPTLGARARERVNDYMRNGGMILFDTRDRGQNGPSGLARLTQGLDIPPLAPVDDAHVLTHSFYILREFPGRYATSPVYAQQGGDPANDNVSPVVIGGGDWAGAWAMDRNGAPMFPVSPGGEAQREIAFRFGVNLVMYALTGSYKADQVHLPAILERMKK